MKSYNEDETRHTNRNWPSSQLSEYQVYPNMSSDGLRRRRITNESILKKENVACERLKMNLIYILIILIVVLVGMLSYTLVILFEEKSDVLEPIIDDVPNVNLPLEQRMWYDDAMNELRDSVKFKQNKHKAKNIILFVGDGMGLSTVTASRIYKYGEEGRLSWESFPHFGLLKVNIHPLLHLIGMSNLFINRFFFPVSSVSVDILCGQASL